jgi:hypothetical protein
MRFFASRPFRQQAFVPRVLVGDRFTVQSTGTLVLPNGLGPTWLPRGTEVSAADYGGEAGLGLIQERLGLEIIDDTEQPVGPADGDPEAA